MVLAESFLARYDNELTAAASMVLALALVVLVNRWISRRGRRMAVVLGAGQLSREADTRLRFARRLVDTAIVLVGLAVALSQFTALDRLASTVLASSAIAAAVVGFAARQTLANAIAGLFLAVTQPLRIGDVVTFDGEMGVVEDIRLTSTWLRTPASARIIVPNERLASGMLRNDSIVDEEVAIEVSVWLAGDVEPVGAVDTLRAALGEDVGVRVAEVASDGTRLLLMGRPAPPSERPRREGELREAALRALAAAASGRVGG